LSIKTHTKKKKQQQQQQPKQKGNIERTDIKQS
jgi:hypothetical protein